MEEEDGRFELPACPDPIVVGVAHLEILERFWNDRIPRRRPPLVMQPFRQGFPDFWRGLLESQDLKRKKSRQCRRRVDPSSPSALWPLANVIRGGKIPRSDEQHPRPDSSLNSILPRDKILPVTSV